VEKWNNVIIITIKHLLLLVLYNRFSTKKCKENLQKQITKKKKTLSMPGPGMTPKPTF